MTHFLELDEADYPLTTKEGWSAFVAETIAPPAALRLRSCSGCRSPSGRSMTRPGRTATPSW